MTPLRQKAIIGFQMMVPKGITITPISPNGKWDYISIQAADPDAAELLVHFFKRLGEQPATSFLAPQEDRLKGSL